MKRATEYLLITAAGLTLFAAGCFEQSSYSISRASRTIDQASQPFDQASQPAGRASQPTSQPSQSTNPGTVPEPSAPAAGSPAELDRQAAFSFAIISDNKGDSPGDSPEFARTAAWIEESGDMFVLGLGDHVKKGWRNSFPGFVKENGWWRSRFIPGIGDGENEYYGKSQGDWGAGAPILTLVKPDTLIDLRVEPNGVDYTAVIRAGAYTIHWIHGHFPDQPDDLTVAFPPGTRKFLVDTVRNLSKGPLDIIIVGAHSEKGSWIDLLDEADKKILMNKADLVIAATTHFFEKQDVEGWPDSGALCLNTGSVSHPGSYCPPGYVQVRIFEKPLRLLVQYVDAGAETREHSIGRYSWLKVPGGKIESAPYREMRPEEDISLVVGVLKKKIGKKALSKELCRRMRRVTDADIAAIEPDAGLPGGEVRIADIWEALPFDNEVWSLRLTRDQWTAVFDEAPPDSLGAEFDAALESYWADRILQHLGLDETLKTETRIRTHELLEEIVRSNAGS